MSKKLNENFPDIIYCATYTRIHFKLKRLNAYVGSPDYALYSSNDGLILERIHIDSINKFYFESKLNALKVLKDSLINQIERVKTYIDKIENNND